MSLEDEIEAGGRSDSRIRLWLARWRAFTHSRPALHLTYQVFVTLLGFTIIIIGLILVPLPGPGWLIVFAGLGVLGSEFRWARRLTTWAKRQVRAAWSWWRERRRRKQQMRF